MARRNEDKVIRNNNKKAHSKIKTQNKQVDQGQILVNRLGQDVAVQSPTNKRHSKNQIEL